MSEGEKVVTYQAQADELSKQLWAIANDLRGSMDASLLITLDTLSDRKICTVCLYRRLSSQRTMEINSL